MGSRQWFAVRQSVAPRNRRMLTIGSFLLPLLLWCLVSYVPFVWHPQVKITDPGGVGFLQPGMQVSRAVFQAQVGAMDKAGKKPPEGVRANPIYLPAPDQVAKAFYTAFTTPPQMRSEKWLYQSLWHSVQIIFWGFFLSSLIGVPLGILCGTFTPIARLTEPFIEFFRYLPAPAFGALAVAVLGIFDGPKIAIIFIGTFFQQVLVIANTTRKLDLSLLEAALTLGSSRWQLLKRVVLPGILPDIHRDQRILLGWAWTYLIVAELVGTSSGITWFITQQARYKNFENVYAAIMIIGFIGVATDLFLAWLGRRLFPWEQSQTKA